MAECSAIMGTRSFWVLVSCVSVGAVIALPSAASAQDATTQSTVPSTTTTMGQTTAASATTGATGQTGADAPTPQKDGRAPAHMSVVVHGIHKDHKVRVGKQARAFGYLRPFVPGEHVRVKLVEAGKVVRNVNPEVNKVPGKDKGRFNFHSNDLIAPGSYKIIAEHERTANQRRVVARSKKFGVDYPDLDPGNRSSVVRTFNQLLDKRGYYSSHGKKYGIRTQWAVMAFRKVNGMARNYNATPRIFRKLAADKGGFQPQVPGRRQARRGRHLQAGDGPGRTMARPSTSSRSRPAPRRPRPISGHFHFYRKDPGYNSERHVLLGVLHPRLRHPRLRPGAALQREPRLRPQPDPRLDLHLQLDLARGLDLRLPVASGADDVA